MLVVEDGTGVAGAESLTSVAFADDYHSKRGNQLWAAIEATRKEQNLRKATDYIVATYAAQWNSPIQFATQGLPFPQLAYPGIVPLAIQQATAELALIADSTPLMPSSTRGKKRVKVGPIEVEYDGLAATATDFVAASLRIGAFLYKKGGITFGNLVRT